MLDNSTLGGGLEEGATGGGVLPVTQTRGSNCHDESVCYSRNVQDRWTITGDIEFLVFRPSPPPASRRANVLIITSHLTARDAMHTAATLHLELTDKGVSERIGNKQHQYLLHPHHVDTDDERNLGSHGGRGARGELRE